MKKIVALFFNYCLLLGLNGCSTDSQCAIKLNHKFEGDGVLLLEENYSEDGYSEVVFFPVCQLDTTNLLKSLERGEKGISFSYHYYDIVSAIRKRNIILTSLNKRRSPSNRKVYLTSVHLSFTDTVKQVRNYRNLTDNYVLETKQVRFKQQIFNVGNLYVIDLYGI